MKTTLYLTGPLAPEAVASHVSFLAERLALRAERRAVLAREQAEIAYAVYQAYVAARRANLNRLGVA